MSDDGKMNNDKITLKKYFGIEQNKNNNQKTKIYFVDFLPIILQLFDFKQL